MAIAQRLRRGGGWDNDGNIETHHPQRIELSRIVFRLFPRWANGLLLRRMQFYLTTCERRCGVTGALCGGK